MSLKRRIPILAVGLLAAMALAAPSAQADDTFGVSACVVGPGVAGQTNVENIGSDIQPGGAGGGAWDPIDLLDVDTGGFQFSGPATCTGVDVAGATGPSVVAPTAVTITATGSYDNIICGTGTANGTGTLVGGGINLTAPFGLTFVAGAGKLSLNNITGNVGADDVNGGEGTGYIQIIPTGNNGTSSVPPLPAESCLTSNTTAFTVLGGFEATLSGQDTP